MGSLNHSLTQAKITCLLVNDERFSVMTKLSLDIHQYDFSKSGMKPEEELMPDICAYPNEVGLLEPDLIKMVEMPLLAVEILSPNQGIKELKDKIQIYFELGVKSCWLVIPDFQLISVYAAKGQFKNFDIQHDTEVIDELIDINVPITKMFGRGFNELQRLTYTEQHHKLKRHSDEREKSLAAPALQ